MASTWEKHVKSLICALTEHTQALAKNMACISLHHSSSCGLYEGLPWQLPTKAALRTALLGRGGLSMLFTHHHHCSPFLLFLSLSFPDVLAAQTADPSTTPFHLFILYLLSSPLNLHCIKQTTVHLMGLIYPAPLVLHLTLLHCLPLPTDIWYAPILDTILFLSTYLTFLHDYSFLLFMITTLPCIQFLNVPFLKSALTWKIIFFQFRPSFLSP
jgi:hypothetical protein